MSGIDSYINDTDGRDNDTEPSGNGSTASSEHGNVTSPERNDAAAMQRDGDGASPEHDNASLLERGNAASPERDRDGAPSEHGGASPSERGGAISLERGDNISPEHDEAIHGTKHPVSAVEEAVGHAPRAEETLSDDRSAAHAAKAASGEGLGSHAAKATSGEDHAAHAKEVPSAYLKKAGDFLGLHKKASAIAAAIALCVVVGISAAVASSSRPTPNSILLSSDFVSYAANAVATTTDAAADEAAAGLIAQHLTPDALNSVGSFTTSPGTFSLTEGEDATSLSEEHKNPLPQPPKTSKVAATPLASR